VVLPAVLTPLPEPDARMRILVDENIPLARELFGSLGEITMVPGREVDERFPGLDGFDVLAIRSVTRITPALIDRATSARAIATATIGTDHIDTAYVERANRTRRQPISVLSAPGSNAGSVADHVWMALAYLTRDAERPFSEMTLGIVGCGNCGTRVARRAGALGVKTLCSDPPLAERDPGFVSRPLEDVLGADFVTFHVPLTREGECPCPTYHMLGRRELGMMGARAYLINCSRGPVVDSAALAEALRRGAIAGAALDVFEGEPEPPGDLIELPALVTPHVAGYAVEAKRRGAVVIYEQVCRLLGLDPMPTEPLLMRGFDPPVGERVEFTRKGAPALDAESALRALLRRVHDIGAVSRELKATLAAERRGELFDRMRKDYSRRYARHELAAYRVGTDPALPAPLRSEIARRLAGFGTAVDGRGAHFILAAR
jgi:erythronate-4-phosphate dehydrogenase